jgi:hypothetical protein
MLTLSNFHTKFNYINNNYDFKRLTYHRLNLSPLQIGQYFTIRAKNVCFDKKRHQPKSRYRKSTRS